MTDAVIFDFDGVLVDTMPSHFRSWQRLATFLGFKLEPSLMDQMRGRSREKSLAVVLDAGDIKATDQQKEFYAQMKHKWYQLEIEKMDASALMPGVMILLDHLNQTDIKLAVASASRNAHTIINKIGITDYFEVILDANTITMTKPDPQVFLECLQKLNCKPDLTYVIEDSPLGIEAAKLAYCKTISIGNTTRDCQADYHFDNLLALDPNIFAV